MAHGLMSINVKHGGMVAFIRCTFANFIVLKMVEATKTLRCITLGKMEAAKEAAGNE